MNRDLFGSLFLYCAKHKLGGTLKYYLAAAQKQKILYQHREDLLSLRGLNHQLCRRYRGEVVLNWTKYGGVGSDHFIYIIYLRIVDTLNYTIARNTII